jgi:response regulator RpfG family c-di-GMP phosphodiesterase
MTLTKRILTGFVMLYIAVVAVTVSLSFMNIKKEVYGEILTQYQEYFRIAESDLNTFFNDISADLVTLSENPLVRTRNDSKFTSFLNADVKTFQYHYTKEEREIIKLFSDYRMSHPYVNSVYMGRKNGSFVRSHPRTQPTRYDPRERPWYQLALTKPDNVQITEAYASVTNTDINIGSVLAQKDEVGGIYGVIGMDVTIDELSNEMRKMVLKYDGYMEFWDSRGIVLISPTIEAMNKKKNDTKDYTEVEANAKSRLMKNANYYRIAYPTNLMKGQLVAYIPSKSVDKEIWAIVKSRVAFITWIIVLVAIFTFLLVEVIILRPIRNMRGALKISSDGVVPQLMNIKAVGEIEDFQNEYNQLIHAIEKEKSELKKIKLLTVASLASLAEIRDHETGLHIIRTQKYLELLAIAFNQLNPAKAINENKMSIMIQCAPLHDIGKVAIPDHILLKPGKLTSEEFEIMKMHTVYGKETIIKGNVGISDSAFIDTAINIVYHHHERWDGSGYPVGLKEDAIPIEARIMTVADVYDALTTKRIYKEAISHDEAVQILSVGEGTQFDPQIIKAFFTVEKAFRAISELYRDE